MRIGPLNISLGKRDTLLPIVGSGIVSDAASDKVKSAIPKKIVYGLTSKRRGGSLNWNDPEFDFKVIAQCLATESLFRRIVDKYVELIWRNGYKITGKNNRAAKYVADRLQYMELTTGVPTEILFREISQQLVTYSNCFIEKVRSDRVPNASRNGHLPIGGYFVIDSTSIKLAKDDHGTVIKYKQEVDGKENSPEWDPYNIIHMYKDREAGLSFGTPMVVPVLDDIRALRRIEENVEMLIFGDAMPLYVYKVGDKDNRPSEADILKAQSVVREKPTEGMLIVPFYHEITAIGSEGRALRCEGYLEYFKNRVLAGLGASEVALGYSGTASRSSAETTEKGMYNTVREFQNILKSFIENEIFRELLNEGNIKWDDRVVEFYFPEIDIDDKIKHENHIVNVFSSNLITETEARNEIGMDPLTESQRTEIYYNMYDLPRTIIQAVDEPFLANFGVPSVLKKMVSQKPSGRLQQAKSLDMPSNQYGTKLSPGTTKDSNNIRDAEYLLLNDSITDEARQRLLRMNMNGYYNTLKEYYSIIRMDTYRYIRTHKDMSNTHTMIGAAKDMMVSKSGVYIMRAYSEGVSNACVQSGVSDITFDYSMYRDYLLRKNIEWIEGVLDDIFSTIDRSIYSSVTDDDILLNDSIGIVSSIFESNEYRVRIGSRNELQRAYNIGIFSGGIALGYSKFGIDSVPYDADGKCTQHMGMEYDINIDMDYIPPGYMTHPLCTCVLKLLGEGTSSA